MFVLHARRLAECACLHARRFPPSVIIIAENGSARSKDQIMAYMDFAQRFAEGAVAVSEPAAPAPGHFSPLEWTTIALARNDSLASLREPGRLSRAMGSLFGRNVRSRLADPGLEMLRRLAVYAWHYGYRLPVSEIKAFLAAGFTVDQLETALASIAQARTSRSRSA